MKLRKILLSMFSIGVVALVAVYASSAFFSDTETSTGNSFEAGAIDLTVDYEGYYNKEVDRQPNAGSWTLRDLTEERFFDLEDLKPGDFGEGTISLHVTSNPAWACVNINPTMNDDNGSTEPELEVDDPDGDSIFDGELAQNMHFMIWADFDCDNIWTENEPILTEGTGPITPRSWAIADSTTGAGPLDPDVTYCLGVAWDIPTEVGNVIQTDKYMSDVSFYVEQARHNEKFECPVQEGFPTNTLRLENEEEVVGGPWEVIVDGTWVDMTYDSSGDTFVYTLNGQGLPASTDYSLIYYADGWPGNNPGAFIGSHSSDGSGLIGGGGNVDLNLDLPDPADGNFAVGAKIWLVLASDYNSGSASTGPMTAWQPDQYLFEGNVYIHYDDTNN